MIQNLTHETRSTSPSFVMRAVKWLIKRSPEVFPKTAEGVEAYLETRQLPAEAPVPPGVARKCEVEEWVCEGQRSVTLHPKSGKGRQHILYFHGGGFVLPIVKEHWVMLGVMVKKTGASITVPLYNLVPEHPHTDAERLADAAYAHLTKEWSPKDLVLCGDSAGAHMALALAMRLARDGKPQAGKLVLYSPWLDVTMADPRMEPIEPHDIMLRIDALRVMGRAWAGERDPASPDCSPLYASKEELSGLPPTAIFVGTHDLFVVDCRTFAPKLAAAGVSTQLYEYVGSPHDYMLVTPSRESKDTLSLLSDFLAR